MLCVVLIMIGCDFVVKSGWGDWAGPGETGISAKILKKRDRLIKQHEADADLKRNERTDVKNKQMFNVMLSDRRIKTASKYKIDEIPHPFTTREEYERSLQMPLGGMEASYFIYFMNLLVINCPCECRGVECNKCCSTEYQTGDLVARW